MWEIELSTPLDGRIVRLEPLAARHVGALRRAAGDSSIWTWMPGPAAFDDLMAAAFEEIRAGERIAFAVVDRETSRAIGSTSYLSLRPEHRGLEIGWTWYEPAAWGSGVNPECKLLLMEHGFERAGALRVEFKTDRRNARSRAALAKLPAQFEGILRNHRVLPDGTLRDSAYYSVIAEDWPVVRATLESRVEAAS